MSDDAAVQKNPLGLFLFLGAIPVTSLLISNVLAGTARTIAIMSLAVAGVLIVFYRLIELGKQPRWVRVLWTFSIAALGLFFLGSFTDMIHPVNAILR